MATLRSRTGWILVAALLVTPGCASTKRDLRARDYWPGGARWKQATIHALKDPGTWVPAAGAAVVSIDDWDEEISDWAVENTPLFGSNQGARDASDKLLGLTTVAMAGTALAVPNGPGAWEFKPERLAIESFGVLLNNGLTLALKNATDREGPADRERVFPSGHTSWAFVTATLARRNVNQLDLPKGGRMALNSTFTAMAAACGWARVEGNVHFPSDVFAGAALGNFVAIFIHDAFLPVESNVQVTAFVNGSEATFSVSFSF